MLYGQSGYRAYRLHPQCLLVFPLPDIAYHETEIAGVGASQYKRLPYVRVLQLRFQNQTIYLQDVDICDKLYGQPAEIEALLGYDFLEGRDWLLEQAFKLLS